MYFFLNRLKISHYTNDLYLQKNSLTTNNKIIFTSNISCIKHKINYTTNCTEYVLEFSFLANEASDKSGIEYLLTFVIYFESKIG